MTLTLEGKRRLVQAKHAELLELVWELYPAGAPIQWRTLNSMTLSGKVVAHEMDDKLRVESPWGFSVITIADIMRATP